MVELRHQVQVIVKATWRLLPLEEMDPILIERGMKAPLAPSSIYLSNPQLVHEYFEACCFTLTCHKLFFKDPL